MNNPANYIRLSRSADYTHHKYVVVLLIAIGLLGFTFIPNFGESVDEWHNAYYGELFLNLYDRGTLFQNPGVEYYNGPFYFMVMTASSHFFQNIIPGWMATDGRHATNFIFFLIGAFCLFNLTTRLMSRRAAWIALLLYLSQPLLIGHAFINQKDTPLMVFFLLSLTLGWRAIDLWSRPGLERSGMKASWSSIQRELSVDWAQKRRTSRIVLTLIVIVSLAILIDLWAELWLYPSVQGILRTAYKGMATGLVQSLFNWIATDAYKTPLDLYLGKLDRGFLWLRILLSFSSIIVLIYGVRKVFPKTYYTWFRLPLRIWGSLLAASIALGLTTSIRLIGPLAGLIISLFFIMKHKKLAYPVLALYWGIAAFTSYLTWPAIWGAPLSQFMEHILATSEFSNFQVLYRGVFHMSENLPWHYVPTLIALQLTLPTVLLTVIGGIDVVCRALRKQFNDVWLILGIWILIPLLLASTGLIPIYDNFRHLLFIVPALIMVASSGAIVILQWQNRRWIQVTLMLLILLPGGMGIITLHPYQYIYYNLLAGGLQGAAGRFNLDYWCTSMRAAAVYANQITPLNAEVAVSTALTTVEPYLRRDIKVYVDQSGTSHPTIGIQCNQFLPEKNFIPQLELVYEVSKGKAVFSIVEAMPAE